MNPVILLFGGTGFKLKRVVAFVVVTMFAILFMPIIAAMSVGTATIGWLAATPDAKAAETQGFYINKVTKNHLKKTNSNYLIRNNKFKKNEKQRPREDLRT